MSEIVILPHEQWKQIAVPNINGTKKYAVSNHGRVVSYTSSINQGKLIAKSKSPKSVGELSFKHENKKVRLKVHKLVAEYFLPQPKDSFTYVIHIDKNQSNNHVDNLMYANYNMYLQHIAGKKVTAPQSLKLFIGEEIRDVDENCKEKKYAITSLGRLISYQNTISDGAIINGAIHKEGYKIWRYKIGTQYKHKLIHRLVAECFLGKPSAEQKFVIHLDYNKLNNAVNNLKWATQEELTLHNSLNETVINKRNNVTAALLEKGRGAKLTTGKVMLLKKILSNPNNTTRKRIIAKQFGISPMQLFRIQTGENWGWLN